MSSTRAQRVSNWDTCGGGEPQGKGKKVAGGSEAGGSSDGRGGDGGSRPRASRQRGRPGGSPRGRRCLPRPLPGRQRAGGSPVPRRRADPVLRSRLGLALTWAARARGAGGCGSGARRPVPGRAQPEQQPRRRQQQQQERPPQPPPLRESPRRGRREAPGRRRRDRRRGRHWAPRARRRRGKGHAPGGGTGEGRVLEGWSPRKGESLVLVSAACRAGWRAESGASLRGRQFIGHLCSEAGSPGGRVADDSVRRTQGRRQTSWAPRGHLG